MLSKPSLESSAGRSVDASTSRASKIANDVGVLGAIQAMQAGASWVRIAAAAARSSALRCSLAKASSAARSGRGIPLGGIIPARTLRTTFSHASGLIAGDVEIQSVEHQPSGLTLFVMADRRNT